MVLRRAVTRIVELFLHRWAIRSILTIIDMRFSILPITSIRSFLFGTIVELWTWTNVFLDHILLPILRLGEIVWIIPLLRLWSIWILLLMIFTMMVLLLIFARVLMLVLVVGAIIIVVPDVVLLMMPVIFLVLRAIFLILESDLLEVTVVLSWVILVEHLAILLHLIILIHFIELMMINLLVIILHFGAASVLVYLVPDSTFFWTILGVRLLALVLLVLANDLVKLFQATSLIVVMVPEVLRWRFRVSYRLSGWRHWSSCCWWMLMTWRWWSSHMHRSLA